MPTSGHGADLLAAVRARATAADDRAQQPLLATTSDPNANACAGSGARASASAASAASAAPAVSTPRKPGLSKHVEYPGDPEAISTLLASGRVDPAGRDLFGLSALHKFCAWDKPELVALLLPYLTAANINAPAGAEKQTCLHVLAESGGARALRHLMAERAGELDVAAVDRQGRTAREVAVSCGHVEVAQLLEAAANGVPGPVPVE